MDGQAPPPLDALAPEPLAVADELPPPPPPLEVEDALPPGMDGQAPPLDGVAPGPFAVSDELPPPPSPTGEVEDAIPVAPDTVNAASSGVPEAGTGGVALTDELRDQIVKQVRRSFDLVISLLSCDVSAFQFNMSSPAPVFS
jgi:La-related protein 7